MQQRVQLLVVPSGLVDRTSLSFMPSAEKSSKRSSTVERPWLLTALRTGPVQIEELLQRVSAQADTDTRHD